MSTTTKNNDEIRIAEEIVSVLPAGTVARVCSDDRETLQYAVRAPGLKLRTIVFRRNSLRRLLADVLRGVKIEYLRRDLERNSRKRAEFQYPRPVRLHHSVTITWATAAAR
ncbi:MAG TPA: hypothetical protein VN181_03340 [Thermoanaerobaculia bacterium]|nr:hypothetical protein [Thermoanaerobaculia bacterium]